MSPIILANDGELRGSIFLAIPPVCPMQAPPEKARAAVPRSVNRLRTYAVGIPEGELEGGGERQDGGDDADAAQTLAQLAIERARFGILQRFVGQPFEEWCRPEPSTEAPDCPCAVTLSKISRMASAFGAEPRPTKRRPAGRLFRCEVPVLLDDDLDAAVLRLAHVVAGRHQQLALALADSAML